jgi:hypothetical protein
VNRIQLNRLESGIKEMQELLRELRKDDDLKELLKLYRRPGWTTPAEYALVQGLTNSIVLQLKNVSKLKAVLVKGSRLVSTA